MNIPELIKEAHDNAVERGFYDCVECEGSGKDEHTSIAIPDKPHPDCPVCKGSKINPNRNIGELLMLIVSVLGEALEAHRCGRFALKNETTHFITMFTLDNVEKDHIWISEFESQIKDTFEDEIADVFIRLFDLCGYLGIELNTGSFYWYIGNFKNIGEELFECVQFLNDFKRDPEDCYLDVFADKLFYICQSHNIPIEKHIKAKMAYNRIRPHKHNKEY